MVQDTFNLRTGTWNNSDEPLCVYYQLVLGLHNEGS
jgi:hypothetical protein